MSWKYGEIEKNASVQYDFFKKKAEPKVCCVNVSGGEIVECVNRPVPIEAITTGAVAKIPVVLTELTVQFNVNSKIDLPECATEIKNIKKRLKITQCLLLQNTNMLFIEGFIRKNIDYATRKCSNEEGICGDIRHCTVDVPIKCATAVLFNGIAPLDVISTTSSEFEYLRTQDLSGPQFADKNELLSGDLTEFNQFSTEYFNELPYCELISSRIVEFDEYLNPQPINCVKAPFEEREFKSIEEKMVVYLTLKILQNRQVAIAPLENDC